MDNQEFAFDDLFNHETPTSSPVPTPTTSIIEPSIELPDKTDEGEFAVDIDAGTKCRVQPEDFELLKLVGKGGFGKVWQVRQRKTGFIYAMKVIRKHFVVKTNNVEYTKTERNILRKIRNPFVVSLHYAFQTHGKLYLVMDFLNGGHLLYHMKKQTMFSEEEAAFYLAEIILALEYLHSLSIIHRDLKPENILLGSSGHVVLTDFGLAKEDFDDSERANTFCGTIEYMAPEMIQGKGYGRPADWWSVGVLMYDMLVGKTPFQHKNRGTLQKKIVSDKIRAPNWLSSEAKNLILGLLKRDPNYRLGADVDKLKGHKFFRAINWNKIAHHEIPPPYRPRVKKGDLDTSNFDCEYTQQPVMESPIDPSFVISASQDALFTNFSYVRSPSL